jgi:hypothetical protein
METVNNVGTMFVVNNVARAVAAGTVIDSYSDLSDGEIAWVTPSGAVVDNNSPNAADYPVLRLVQRNGTDLLISDDIDVRSIKHYSITSYSAPTQKVEYVGYNGSAGAGSIQALDSNLYYMRFLLYGNESADFMQQNYKHGVYESDASATQYDIAEGLVHSITNNFKNEKQQQRNYIQAAMVCSATVTAGNCFDNNATVIQGLDSFTVASNVQYGGVAAVVGDYIRLTGPSASGTALTSSVYRITAISSLTITVDRPILEASGTYAAGDDELEVIPAATAQAADWGIKLTGVANKFEVGKYRYWVVSWDTTLEGFGTTTAATTVTDPSEGIGSPSRVAELEWYYQGNEGTPFRTQKYGPAHTSRAMTNSSTTYDILRLAYAHQMDTNLGKQNDSPKWLTIALDVTSNSANQISGGVTCLVTVADDWIVTSFGITGMTAQIGNLT